MFRIGKKDNERIHLKSVDRHFYINGPIEDDEDFLDLIDALYMGKPEDTIYIHLNTPGGRMDIGMQILNAIKTSNAEVVGIADGEVASAGSLILFACPNIAVMPYSFAMLHDGSNGVGGKLNENLKQAQFNSNLIKKIYHDIYSAFFTKKEIDEILDGKDMWISSEEIKLRIKKVLEVETKEEIKKVQKRMNRKKGQDAEKQVQE